MEKNVVKLYIGEDLRDILPLLEINNVDKGICIRSVARNRIYKRPGMINPRILVYETS